MNLNRAQRPMGRAWVRPQVRLLRAIKVQAEP